MLMSRDGYTLAEHYWFAPTVSMPSVAGMPGVVDTSTIGAVSSGHITHTSDHQIPLPLQQQQQQMVCLSVCVGGS